MLLLFLHGKYAGKRNSFHMINKQEIFILTCLVLLSCVPIPALSLLNPLPVAKCENGAGTEYGLMVCNNCTTTFETFLNDNFRRFASPTADLTPNVLSINGCIV
jgi:hypothetical protein